MSPLPPEHADWGVLVVLADMHAPGVDLSTDAGSTFCAALAVGLQLGFQIAEHSTERARTLLLALQTAGAARHGIPLEEFQAKDAAEARMFLLRYDAACRANHLT